MADGACRAGDRVAACAVVLGRALADAGVDPGLDFGQDPGDAIFTDLDALGELVGLLQAQDVLGRVGHQAAQFSFGDEVGGCRHVEILGKKLIDVHVMPPPVVQAARSSAHARARVPRGVTLSR
jgi:hypothetical protein